MLVLKHVYPAHGSDGKTYDVHVYAESADPVHGAPTEKLKSVVLADGPRPSRHREGALRIAGRQPQARVARPRGDMTRARRLRASAETHFLSGVPNLSAV